MAKTPAATKATAPEPDEKKIITPAEQANAYMQAHKPDHYNFEEGVYYKVPNSSLTLTSEMGGGIPPGAHRAVGITRMAKRIVDQSKLNLYIYGEQPAESDEELLELLRGK